nr:hypothetical protein [Tanacetum cinerariifolium]
MAFISSTKHSRGNDDVNTASSNVPTASANVATVSISQETACAYIASQSGGSQIKFEDINQINEDNMDEMDIKLNMALLSMRADKFWKKIWKNISIQGSDIAGFDKSKVECFNCHKMGHFARECKAPKNQKRGRRDTYKHGSKAEEHTPKALMAIDEVGWDWSYIENNEEDHALAAKAPTEFALMADTSTENKVFDNSLCSKDCKKNNDSLNTSKDLDNLIESQRSDKSKEGLGYTAVPPPVAQLYLSPKKDLSWTGLLECADDIVTDYSSPSPTVESSSEEDQNRNPSASKNVASPITPKQFVKFVKGSDSQSKSKTDEKQTPEKPPVKNAKQYRKPNKKPNVIGNQRNWNNLKSYQLGLDFVMKKKACFNCGNFNHLAYECRKRVKRGTTRSQNNKYKSTSQRPVVHRPNRSPMRSMRPNMNCACSNKTPFNKSKHSYTNKPFQRKSTVISQYRALWVPTANRNFPPVNRKFSTGDRNFSTVNKKFSTTSRKFPTGSTKGPTSNMGMKGKAIKSSACWSWKPLQNLSNKGLKNNSVSVVFKKYTYIDTQGKLNFLDGSLLWGSSGMSSGSGVEVVEKAGKARTALHVICINCKNSPCWYSFADDKISEVSYYISESESESKYETSKYYDNTTTYAINHNVSEGINKLIRKFNKKIAKFLKRIEKANQQNKDFENQNKDLQDKYDVLKNQATTFETNNKELNEQLKMLIEKNDDLLAQTKVLKDQLQVKHVVIDTHVECQEKYAKLEAERYEYMIRYYAYFDNDKQHRKQIADQEVLYDKMSVQLVELDKLLEILKTRFWKKTLKYPNWKNTVHMIMPSKDTLYNGRKGICFENPSYFKKAKDLRPGLYDEKVIGLGYTSMFLTHSDEALEIEKFKRSRENKIEFAYDYGSLNASYQTSSLKPYVSNVILEKIIIDLEDEVVSLLEKEKANLETIKSMKLKGFESSENAISEIENQSKNDCQVVEKECDNVENPKVIAPGMFKLNLDTLSSVRRPKHSDVIWKKKGSSNTSNVDLSSVNHLKLNKDVKLFDSFDENNLFIFDDESVRMSLVSKMTFTKKPREFMNVRSKSNSNKSLPRTVLRWLPKMQPLAELVAKWIPKIVQICLWIIDSVCSKHMTSNYALLTNFVKKFLGTVRFGNNDFAVIAGYGDVVIGSMKIKKVYYVEGLDGVDLLIGDRSSNLYAIALNKIASNSLTCFLAKASSLEYWLWHQRLSHLNFATINNLMKNNLVQGLPKMKFKKDHLCFACEQGKIHGKHHKSKTDFASNKPLYLLHMDLCGPMHVESINGKRYVLVVVDDYSRRITFNPHLTFTFNLQQEMDQQYPTIAKIPVLDTGKFEQWQFWIQQYLQHEHYALWEKKKNDVKERTTLLLSLPDEHQLRFKGLETLEQTFNGLQVIVGQLQFIDVEIEQDDLNQKFLTSLAPEWLMHTIVWRNKSDLDTMSLDDLYNHLKVYESETWNKISIQGSDVAGFDKSKVECFNCHKMGHFARECRAPRSQDRGRGDNYRQGSKAEEQAPKALME